MRNELKHNKNESCKSGKESGVEKNDLHSSGFNCPSCGACLCVAKVESLGNESVGETKKKLTENVTDHFKWSEFDCKDGTKVPEGLKPSVLVLAKQLEVLRAELGGKTIRINSGYRTKDYNARVKGKPSSMHLQAKAADIVVNGVSPKQVHETIERLIRNGKMYQGGLGLYEGHGFVHYDIRGTKARWIG